MKRWIGSVALLTVSGAVMAQAPFNLMRPFDGERIKEKIQIRFPASSIPASGYVGIFLDGKLIDATRPGFVQPKNKAGKNVGRGYFEYVLDVKGRGISDTKPGETTTLEAVLFAEAGDQPRRVDSSSVKITIDRKAGIKLPAGGARLRYNFTPGEELIYRIEQRSVLSAITESQNKLGGKAAEFPQEGETIRMLYAVQSVEPVVIKGQTFVQSLLRMQPLPNRGKDYADLTTTGSSEAKRYYDYEMAPIYMKVSDTGIQKWGSIPPYITFEGTTGEANRLDLYGSFPLPTLPEKRVRPGDSWSSSFQTGFLDLEKLNDVTSVVRTIPARGEFLGLEWERNRPCVKFRNVIEVADNSLEASKLAKAGAGFKNDFKVSVNETVWFDLDSKRVTKVVREETVDVKAAGADLAGFGFGGGIGGGSAAPGAGAAPGGFVPGGRGPGGPGGPPAGFGPASRPGGFGGAAGGGSDKSFTPDIQLRQEIPGNTKLGRFGGPSGGPAAGAGFGGRQGAPVAAEASFIRIRSLRIFTLER